MFSLEVGGKLTHMHKQCVPGLLLPSAGSLSAVSLWPPSNKLRLSKSTVTHPTLTLPSPRIPPSPILSIHPTLTPPPLTHSHTHTYTHTPHSSSPHTPSTLVLSIPLLSLLSIHPTLTHPLHTPDPHPPHIHKQLYSACKAKKIKASQTPEWRNCSPISSPSTPSYQRTVTSLHQPLITVTHQYKCIHPRKYYPENA